MRTHNFVETYERHLALCDNKVTWFWIGVLLLGLITLPFVAGGYVLAVAIALGVAVVGAVGLNILTGVTGLISLGQAGFLATGCYTTGLLVVDYGWPPELALPAGGVMSALVSLIVGIPSLRLKGLYLAITTMAFSFIITHFLLYAESITHGPYGVRIEDLGFFGLNLAEPVHMYFLVLIVAILTILAALNILRSRVGRAFTAIRDHDIAAKAMGINLVKYKLISFAVSSFFVGIAGGLMAFQFRFINVDIFTVLLSVEALAMVIVGGLGSVAGAVLGAFFIVLLPEVTQTFISTLSPSIKELLSLHIFELRGLLTGLVIIVMLRVEPHGLIGLWRNIKRYWAHWPLSV